LNHNETPYSINIIKYMRNRDLALRELEKIENNIKVLEFMVKSATPVSEFRDKLGKTSEIVQNLKDLIEREQFKPTDFYA
jgi:archaellum component FlaC